MRCLTTAWCSSVLPAAQPAGSRDGCRRAIRRCRGSPGHRSCKPRMQHLDLRLGGTRYLLCDPQTTSDGRPAGYGNMLRNAEQAIRAAAALGATLLFIPSGRPLNAAVFDLESPDARILGQSGWRPAALRALWRVGKPVRYGAPVEWAASTVAAAV